MIFDNELYFGWVCRPWYNKENRDQVCEIKDVKLYTKEEAKLHIRDYNDTKITLINYIFNFIDNYEKDLIIK